MIVSHTAKRRRLATIFEGDNDRVYPFTRAFAARIESVGIETTFGVKTTLDPRTPSSNESDAIKKTLDEEYADDRSNWHYDQYLQHESVDNLVDRAVEDSLWLTERISKLEEAPRDDSDKGPQDFLEQQHRMWIAELIYASVNNDVRERLANHEELHRNDGAVMWAIFMTE
jgi:hypothetical protein